MSSIVINQLRRFFIVLLGLIVLSVAMIFPFTVQAAGQEGMDIKIRAQNRSTADTTTFCDMGAGLKGDRLDVDVSTDSDGNAVGTARFQDGNGNVTLLDIDTVLVFFGGLLLQDSATGNAIPIWFGPSEVTGANYSPMHVNVELPRGCFNTASTFTVGQDKTTVQIKTN